MSGPKDFILLPNALRLAEIANRRATELERRNQFLRERARENQERLRQEAEKIAARRVEQDEFNAARGGSLESQRAVLPRTSELRTARHAHESERILERKAAESESRTQPVKSQLEDEAKKSTSNQTASSSSEAQQSESITSLQNSKENDESLSVEQITLAQDTPQQPEQKGKSRVNDEIFVVLQWKDLLFAEQNVSEFERPNLEAWTTDCNSLLDPRTSLGQHEFTDHAERLVARAKQMQSDAGEKAAKFNTRNELLTDLIDSLKEIGFFVANPRFDNPQDPGGPVVLVATRGNERMEARIDLGNQIKSTWDEISTEHCKASFFEYVDAMHARGVEVKAAREDLQSRPERIRVNAKDLPRKRTDNV